MDELAVEQKNEFAIESKRSEHCVTMTEAGSFSCLRIRFRLKRKFYTAFASYMMPISLFVFIAYLTFYIPCSANGSNQLNGHLIQARIVLLIYSLTALYWTISSENAPPLLVSQDSAYSTNNSASLSFWYLVNLVFVLIAIIEFVLQLNQSPIRVYLVRKLMKDDKLNHNPDHGSANGQRNNALLNAKTSTRIQLNSPMSNGGSNLPTVNNQDTITSNQSTDTDNYSKQNAKNKSKSETFYLRMLGLRQQSSNHPSSRTAVEQEFGKDYNIQTDDQESLNWLDQLFQIFYALFYVAFLVLFTFITFIG